MDPLKNTIQSMYSNNKLCWDAIEEMGGETDVDHNLSNLAAAILSINSIFPPDLSKPLDKAQLDNLQNIVSQGKAPEYLNLGDELLVNYSSYVMPFEVVGFDDVEVEGGEAKYAINLLAKYTDETGSAWGANGSTRYSASPLRTNITSTYQGKLDSDFISCLALTKVQTYSRNGSTDVVYDKLFAPSMSQLGVTNASYTTAYQTAIEGPAFTAYEGAADSKRVKQAINATGTAQFYWTRTLALSISGTFCGFATSGAPSYGGYDSTRRAVVACNFISKS